MVMILQLLLLLLVSTILVCKQFSQTLVLEAHLNRSHLDVDHSEPTIDDYASVGELIYESEQLTYL
jgi:hypothetical protein